jgi:hypothetical protein
MLTEDLIIEKDTLTIKKRAKLRLWFEKNAPHLSDEEWEIDYRYSDKVDDKNKWRYYFIHKTYGTTRCTKEIFKRLVKRGVIAGGEEQVPQRPTKQPAPQRPKLQLKQKAEQQPEQQPDYNCDQKYFVVNFDSNWLPQDIQDKLTDFIANRIPVVSLERIMINEFCKLLDIDFVTVPCYLVSKALWLEKETSILARQEVGTSHEIFLAESFISTVAELFSMKNRRHNQRDRFEYNYSWKNQVDGDFDMPDEFEEYYSLKNVLGHVIWIVFAEQIKRLFDDQSGYMEMIMQYLEDKIYHEENAWGDLCHIDMTPNEFELVRLPDPRYLWGKNPKKIEFELLKPICGKGCMGAMVSGEIYRQNKSINM